MKNLQRTQKAWTVYHDGMIRYEHGYYQHIDELPVVYADTQSKAKTKGFGSCFDYPKKDESEIKFLDLLCIRAKKADKYLYEGEELTEREIEKLIADNIRKDKLKALPDDKMYVIQKRNEYVGNMALFWGTGSCGYNSNIANVQRYTKKEMLEICLRSDRVIVWDADYIDSVLIKVVDVQYLNHDNCVE